MSKLIDLTGQTFGRLTVLALDHKKPKKCGGNVYYWRCLCSCGNTCVVRGADLTRTQQKSCGCSHKGIHSIHGMSNSKIYKVWTAIKKRCFNTHCKQYADYGGRGITMHPAWIDDFQAFYGYVSELPHFGEEKYSLDRINNNGNYEPGNLKFSTRTEQNRNKRTNIIVEYQGTKMTLADAAVLARIKYTTLVSRYKRGDRGYRLFRIVQN